MLSLSYCSSDERCAENLVEHFQNISEVVSDPQSSEAMPLSSAEVMCMNLVTCDAIQ